MAPRREVFAGSDGAHGRIDPAGARPKAASSAARRRLTRAQTRLDELEAAHSAMLERIARARRRLDIQEVKALAAYRQAREVAEAALDEARRELDS